ncbi:GvpL/GvpF family gas vesicle protein [Prochlorothrix hollandica]|uniref:Protein gvpF/L n=1 Tax=Prochlorothrix hollandica PCC 9006 = CALU 1027 TaxID=317619 RepID=A0A0M2PWF5_PROHO|nr:GvpL/GvpF family gas vesicle protein [Prochlorothrix hollandica]KKI99412.1 protein gvpF/L [Prochlorothrix hollandica PCC 9006 = CALU 1027]
MANGFYLYGIFPPPGPTHLDMVGLDKQPVRLQNVDGFVFLYSEAQQDRYLASRRNLLGHAQVLEKAMVEGCRTLLPLPLNRLIVQSWDEVADQFTIPYGETLKQLFTRLEGKREVSVKVYWDEGAELETLMAENADLQAQRELLEGKKLSMEQVIAIGQSIESGLRDRQSDVMDVFRQTLNPYAIALVDSDPQTQSMIYNTAYLIPWDTEPAFSQAVEALDRQFGDRLRIRYNNFTAPYNFAQLDQLE